MNDASSIPKNKEPYVPLESDSHELITERHIVQNVDTIRPVQLQMTNNHDMSKYDYIAGEQIVQGSSKIYPIQMQMANDIVVNIDGPDGSFDKTKLPKRPEKPKINNASKSTKKNNNNEESCLLCCSCCCETANDFATCYLYMWLFSSMQHENHGDSSLPCLCKSNCCDGCNCSDCNCSDCNCSDCDCDCNF